MAVISPKLTEDVEYIGNIYLDEDYVTLRIGMLYKSPVSSRNVKSEVTYASVPAKLVEKVGEKPALFMFHTHPIDPKCCPLPSSPDLSTAIYYGVSGRFAGNVIFSQYGVLVYGPGNEVIRNINSQSNQHDWELCLLNYSHDVVVGHESMRSWSKYTAEEYISFYRRYRMFFYIYPTASFVAWHDPIVANLKSPVDHETIKDHADNIKMHKRRRIRGTIPDMDKNKGEYDYWDNEIEDDLVGFD